MKVLGVECSSGLGSAAFWEDGRVVCRMDLPANNGRSSVLFSVLDELCSVSGWTWDEVDLFAAGRGPGRYSGMRVALTAVQGLAAPARRPVYAISSGAALAHAVASTRPDATRIAVVGDARRDQLWVGLFERAGDAMEQRGDWTLTTADNLSEIVPAGAWLVTSEWSRLKDVAARCADDGSWIREDWYPRAEDVAALAARALSAGAQSDPLTPIYLHPAVKTA